MSDVGYSHTCGLTTARGGMPAAIDTQRRIAWRALTLAERLRGAEPGAGADAGLAAAAAATMRRWQVSAGGVERLHRRLAWDGLDAATVQSRLSCPPRPDLPPPAWLGTFADIVDAVRTGPVSGPSNAPFAPLLAPVAHLALRRVRHAPGSDLVASDALRDHSHALLAELAGLFARPLLIRFDRVRPQVDRLSVVVQSTAAARTPTQRFDRFVAEESAAGLLDLFDEFPVLARLGATLVDQWVACTTELLARLHADRQAIAERFAGGADPGVVTHIDAGLSDRHNGGRAVTRLRFGSGSTVIYKPRPVLAEAVLADALLQAGAHGAPHLPAARVIARDEYGWMQDIEQRDCGDEAGVARFYTAAGGIAAVLHALLGSDAHCDNLIASGDALVIVDAETLPQPLVPGENAALLTALRTGLLPQWQWHAGSGVVHDISGLGVMDTATPGLVPGWVAVNTDEMHWGGVQRAPTPAPSLPRRGDTPLSPADHVAELLNGFAAWHRRLRDERDGLLNGALQPLQDAAVRVVYRPTDVYARLLARASAPQALRDGPFRSVTLDVLRRPFLDDLERPVHWALLDAEQHDLERLDVPWFTTAPGAAHLTSGGRIVVRDFFDDAPAAALRRHLLALDEADLALQSAILRSAVTSGCTRRGADRDTAVDRDVDVAEEAAAIAARICTDALHFPDGSVRWLGAVALEGQALVRFDLLGDDLYDGGAGVALFLAAYAAAANDAQAAALALGALRPLRRLAERTGAVTRLGAARGLGGCMYALVRSASLLGHAELHDDARALARLLTAEVIRQDRHLDVFDGVAGAIPGLLALHAAVGGDELLHAARLCGDHLLHCRTHAAGGAAWRTIGDEPMGGFAHGAAGIALALARLAAITGDGAYRSAAEQGIAFEGQLFNEAIGDWRSAWQSDAHPSAPGPTWCHGASGIGLARLAGLPALDTPAARRDIRSACERVLAAGLPDLDHLCCGAAGQIELLLAAAAATGIDAGTGGADLGSAAVSRGQDLVRRSRQRGGYALFGEPGRTSTPGFFQGIAGVGYTLLRLSGAASLPCVAAWE